jgi:hypothetical protein
MPDRENDMHFTSTMVPEDWTVLGTAQHRFDTVVAGSSSRLLASAFLPIISRKSNISSHSGIYADKT